MKKHSFKVGDEVCTHNPLWDSWRDKTGIIISITNNYINVKVPGIDSPLHITSPKYIRYSDKQLFYYNFEVKLSE